MPLVKRKKPISKKSTTRKYHPDRILKPSGVHSFYLGQEEDPLVLIFDSYCKLNQCTFSHGVRSILTDFFQEKALLDGNGNLLPEADDYHKKAARARREQKKLLAMGYELKPRRNKKRASA